MSSSPPTPGASAPAAAPYRTAADGLGDLRTEYRPSLKYAMFAGALVVVLGGGFLAYAVSVVRGLGSLAAMRADLAAPGKSQLLAMPLLALPLVPVMWAALRIGRGWRRERVRFYEGGIELVGGEGKVRRCRYEEIGEVGVVDDQDVGGRGPRVTAVRVVLQGGEVWAVSPWFDVQTIAARLEVARRARHAAKAPATARPSTADPW
jgi:hypothetical protein